MITKLKILAYLILLLFVHHRVEAQLVSSSYFHFDFILQDSVKYNIKDIKCLKIDSEKLLEGCMTNANPNNDKTLYSISIKNQENQDDIQIYFYIDEKIHSTIIPLRGIFEVILPENMWKGTYCFNLYDSDFSESNLALKKEYESNVDSLRKLKRKANHKSQLEINQKIENTIYDLKSEFYRFSPVQLNGEYASNTVVEITSMGMYSNVVSESIITPIEIEEYIKNRNKEKPKVIQKILSVFDEEKQN